MSDFSSKNIWKAETTLFECRATLRGYGGIERYVPFFRRIDAVVNTIEAVCMWAYDKKFIAPHAETSQPSLKDYIYDLTERDRSVEETLKWINRLRNEDARNPERVLTDRDYFRRIDELYERQELDKDMLSTLNWRRENRTGLESQRQAQLTGGSQNE